ANGRAQALPFAFQEPRAMISEHGHATILHAHLFAGLGGGARGFNRATSRVGNLTASFRCLGGIDVDAGAIRDFGRLAGVPGTCMDLFDREQYRDFHGQEPPIGWREATVDDVRAAFGHERPHVLFTSPPCKGFSGLLSETKSRTRKYQALNRLTLRGIWLTLEAYRDDPVELILLENVPRIASRGRPLLDRITGLLRAYGYAVAETTHDCGQLGGLAQSRRRFLLVARHTAKVKPFLYQPPKRPLHGVGDILSRMSLPGDPAAGPMHRVPMLHWSTWVRLAFVEAGSDWRSLGRLAVEDGMLRDYALAPCGEWRGGVLGVNRWDEPSGTVAGRSGPSNGAYSVADPRRAEGVAAFGQYGVKRFDEPSQVVIGKAAVGAGHFAVADPRHAGPPKHSNEFRIVPWDGAGRAVTGAHGTGQCVADPRGDVRRSGALGVVSWESNAGTVAGESLPSNGTFAVADPRPHLEREKGDDYYGAGHYGVVPWREPTGAVSAAAGYDNGRWSVADPRPILPSATEKVVARIRALDGTWHRPFTTAELAALQSLFDPEEQAELDGLSDADWRERIGNAVPPDAAQAIAETMGRTLLLAWSGEGFMLSALPIWVRPVAVALSVRQPQDEA
ncbi:DNA cytosine methyltransferase, partial [Roseomonas mucosa]